MEHKQGIATLKDVAKFFGRLPGTINKAVLKGQLPPPVLVSDVKVWTWDAIYEHVRNRELEAKRKREAGPRIIEMHPTAQQHNNL